MWLFALSVLALIASPGPDFFYVLGRGMAQGPRAGLLSALGIALGLCGHTLLAVLGLSALLAASPWLFWAVKMAGAAYLFWIGLKLLRLSAPPRSQPGEQRSAQVLEAGLGGRAIVRQALLTNLLNPKAALTFVAFLPQWVRTETHGSTAGAGVAAQFAMLGAITAGLALAWFSVVGVASARLGVLLRRHPRVESGASRATGVLLLALGLALALQKR